MKASMKSEWTAIYQVAAELTRRDYLVGWVMGNTPEKDLMVESPKGERFNVDVKGATFAPRRRDGNPSAHAYPVQSQRLNGVPVKGLYYVFVAIPPVPQEKCEFAVLSHQQLLDARRNEDMESAAAPQPGKELKEWTTTIDHRSLAAHFGRWNCLPE
jgi:hypothetical protein